ncbi:MAG: AMP-binding protein [Novosphingobium sp.]|nr:AMP-binding protein [Novosphingobium sp.]
MGERATRRQAGKFSIRWDEARARQAYAQGRWVRETLADALDRAAARDPGRVLIVDGAVRLDAITLHRQAQVMAAALAARMAPGSVVSFMLPNWHEAAVVYLGATLAGMVASPILPSLRDHDLRFILSDAGTRMIFVPGEFRGHDYPAMLRQVALGMADPPEVVVVRGEGGVKYDTLLEGLAPDRPFAPLDPDTVRLILYTSGTTGRPKGVLHTHNSLHALLRQIGAQWHVEPGDAFLVPSPVSHIGGSIYAFEAPLLLGTRAVLMDRWDPAEAVPLMEAEGITHMAGATPFLRGLLDAARAAGTRLPALKVFICGGASVSPALIEEARAYFARALVSRVYGSTEVPVTTVGALEPGDKALAAQTDGRPGIAEVRLGPGDEICARGPQMLGGYLHPEDEDGAFDDDGFYRSGDQGRWAEGGCLVVSGRIKDLIIRNGENIAPKEIEDLLLAHPAVAEIAIVGLPDARTGERACAVVVPREGQSVDVAGLAALLAEQGVARFKVPEQVVLRTALPKNEAGKVLKHVLRAELSAA